MRQHLATLAVAIAALVNIESATKVESEAELDALLAGTSFLNL